jgi:hypothetical protein
LFFACEAQGGFGALQAAVFLVLLIALMVFFSM